MPQARVKALNDSGEYIALAHTMLSTSASLETPSRERSARRRIEALKASIADGTYEVDARAVAGAILQVLDGGGSGL